MQVQRFVRIRAVGFHLPLGGGAVPPSVCDVGSDARNSKNSEIAIMLGALLPCGKMATTSSFVSRCFFVIVENIETCCSPFSTVLPPGSRGEVVRIDEDGDALVRFPSADWLNDGKPLCIPSECIGRCQHLMKLREV
jgi:hypothetical protein